MAKNWKKRRNLSRKTEANLISIGIGIVIGIVVIISVIGIMQLISKNKNNIKPRTFSYEIN